VDENKRGHKITANDNAEVPPEERAGAEMSQRYPTPRCFAQRVRKVLKTNEVNVEKSAKREKESARI
jgi:hypothetical protein